MCLRRLSKGEAYSLPVLRHSLYLFRQSAGDLFQWNWSSEFSKTLTRIMLSLFLMIVLARWYILLMKNNISQSKDVLVYFETRYSTTRATRWALLQSIHSVHGWALAICIPFIWKEIEGVSFCPHGTEGLKEDADRALEEITRGYTFSYTSWREFLPMAKFFMHNSVHASNGTVIRE